MKTYLAIVTILCTLSVLACAKKEKSGNKATPKAMPKAAPKATPKGTPKTTPKAMTKTPAMKPVHAKPAPATTAGAPKMTGAWIADKGLRVPESVMYDAKGKRLFISNIGEKPTVKSKKGFIAIVDLKGTVTNPKWVTGLNAPKGMGIVGEFLYVTDIDRLLRISIPKAAITKVWTVKGAKFLNDIAADAQGSIYVTDMLARRIHIVRGDKLKTFMEVPYDRPNGLYMDGSTLWVGTAAGLASVETTTKKISLVIAHKGGIDGLKPFGKGRYLVSDWKGKVEIIEKGKAPLVLSDTSEKKINAADFEYIPEKALIIVPTFFDNRVMAYHLK